MPTSKLHGEDISQRSPKTLLIVDNDLLQVKELREFVTAIGLECVDAFNGFEALAKIRQYPIGIVLMDIRIPGMDGIETLNHIKRKHPNLPVILMSSYHEKIIEANQGKLDAFAIIEKPIPLRSLGRYLREKLNANS